MLLVSHDPRAIAMFCDRAVLLEGGRIVMEGAPCDVTRTYTELLTAAPTPAAALASGGN